jgi:hypothetical protein
MKVSRRFGGTYRLHLQVRTSGARYQRESRRQAAGIFLGLFEPEEGSDMFILKVG